MSREIKEFQGNICVGNFFFRENYDFGKTETIF